MRLNALTPPSGGPSPRSGARLWIYKSGCQYIYFGIEACVSHDIECAARLRGMLQADEVTNDLLRFPIANPFGLVCFTAIPPSLNAKILGEVGSSGFMIYPSELIDGTPIIRVAFGRGPCVTQAVYQLKEATLTIGMRHETQFKFQATTFIQ
ncbi:hypothetical protein FOZ63_010433, partial [Perkinsus olseni]